MLESSSNKERYIEDLFSSIAPKYDLLNSILSFNCHKRWRRFAVRQCGLSPGDAALDVCAGTLDLAIELSKAVGETGRVVGVDFCAPMLMIGVQKLVKRRIDNVFSILGNVERLPVPSNAFRAATIGFALRNVESVENTLAEMTRAVEPGGRVVSVELAKPSGRCFGRVYDAYFNRLLPILGGAVHGRREHYEYLPASLASFCSREELARVMEKVGLGDIQVHDLTGGAVAVHVGIKK